MKLKRTSKLRPTIWMAAVVLLIQIVPPTMRLSNVEAQTIPYSLIPVQVPGFTNAIAVSAGGAGSMALTSTGQVWCWGLNNLGQLGNGTTGGISAVPVNVSTLSNVTAIASGGITRLALTSAGKVYRWGAVGAGTNANLPQGAPKLQTSTIAIASGDFHCMALKSDGTVFTFGENNEGQLGNGTTTVNYTPTLVPNLSGVVQIAAGGSHCLALKSDGTLWAWGNDIRCQLGNGACSFFHSTVPTPVVPFATVLRISAGEEYSLAVTPDAPGNPGRMYGWGFNFDGELGDSTYQNRPTPVICPTLGGVSKAVSGPGSRHTVIMLVDGSVWACGSNFHGELGNGTFNGSNIPGSCNALGYTVPAVDVAAGFQHSLAALSDGTVWAWGWNQSGQLGVG